MSLLIIEILCCDDYNVACQNVADRQWWSDEPTAKQPPAVKDGSLISGREHADPLPPSNFNKITSTHCSVPMLARPSDEAGPSP